MLNTIISQGAKFVSKFSKAFNLGNGSTWPGHIALGVNYHIISDILKNSSTEIILIVGTNGKTTTGKILTTILEENGGKVVQNTSGANLLNGIASSLLLNTSLDGSLRAQYAVFEVDENNLPIVLQHLTPKAIIALDLFRDQLDRYGELDSIAKKWNAAFQTLPENVTLILNADDPLMAYLAKDVKSRVVYFGLPQKEKGQRTLEHAADSIYCPNCGYKLQYKKIFYSHLGIWECPNCHIKRPQPVLSEVTSPLPGTYNIYNTLAAVLTAQELGISRHTIDSALQKVTPAFGRQEKITINGKHIQIFLSKNPTSMNESLKTVVELSNRTVIASEAKQSNASAKGIAASSLTPRNDNNKPTVLFVLNDRIVDGQDISWIWDISMEEQITKFSKVIISGDRSFDMGLRVQYTLESLTTPNLPNMYVIEPNLNLAIKKSLELLKPEETLFILPTYSAMLDVRKILTGRKIL